MEICVNRLLERRFGEWSAGRTLAALSAATLLGLGAPAEAPAISDTLTLTTLGTIPTTSDGGFFTIVNCQAQGCTGPPTFTASAGATIDLLTITNLGIINTLGGAGATLTINFSHQFGSEGAIPANPSTPESFGASIAGFYLIGTGSSSSVQYTAAGFDDVINGISGGGANDSFAGGTGGPSLQPDASSGFFGPPNNLIVEDNLACPGFESAFCNPLFQGRVRLVFANALDEIIIPGSIKEGATPTSNKANLILALRDVPAPPTALLVALGAAVAIAIRRRLLGARP